MIYSLFHYAMLDFTEQPVSRPVVVISRTRVEADGVRACLKHDAGEPLTAGNPFQLGQKHAANAPAPPGFGHGHIADLGLPVRAPMQTRATHECAGNIERRAVPGLGIVLIAFAARRLFPRLSQHLPAQRVVGAPFRRRAGFADRRRVSQTRPRSWRCTSPRPPGSRRGARGSRTAETRSACLLRGAPGCPGTGTPFRRRVPARR